ncbi:hypothetical protein L484_027867 [Morus notabilis]|uniref:Uncharacterized protein n=1 Tax=Morus notabilis TaxID=981085 RepID=W9SVV8_9ROSA|nr:hypothetical protein L484_027867 [Morus notabilis]
MSGPIEICTGLARVLSPFKDLLLVYHRSVSQWDKTGDTMRFVGDNASYFDTAAGIHMRDCVEPYYNTWKSIPKEDKQKIPGRMLAEGCANEAAEAAYVRKDGRQETNSSVTAPIKLPTCNVNEITILKNVLGMRRCHHSGVELKLSQRQLGSSSSSVGSQSGSRTTQLTPKL